MQRLKVSVAIPTYGREGVLLDTIRAVQDQVPSADEILVIDQTSQHEEATQQKLRDWSDQGQIRWIRLSQPSIPQAMNKALRVATHSIVLFLDDDIVPAPGLIQAHWRCYEDDSIWGVVGQVIQPWHADGREPEVRVRGGIWAGLGFPFHGSQRQLVHNCMAGNLSLRRNKALSIGGFDENFVRVAHRFESEFARRVWRNGGTLLFEPAASIRHLHVSRGGTRSYTTLLRTHRPDHAVGDYYFAMLHGPSLQTAHYILLRALRSLATRYLATHPWWIPAKALGELRGFLWALRLVKRGQRLLPVDDLPPPRACADPPEQICAKSPDRLEPVSGEPV